MYIRVPGVQGVGLQGPGSPDGPGSSGGPGGPGGLLIELSWTAKKHPVFLIHSYQPSLEFPSQEYFGNSHQQ